MNYAEKRKFGKNMSGRAIEQEIQKAERMKKHEQEKREYNAKVSHAMQQNARIIAIKHIAEQQEKKRIQKQKQFHLLQTKKEGVSLMGITGKTLTGLMIASWFVI